LVRILVVGDEALLRSLTGRFGPGIEVVVARSVSQAVVQALVERPSLIVCSALGLERPLDEFWGDLQKVGLDGTPLLCVGESPHADRDPGASNGYAGVEFCSEETLLEAAAALLPAARTGPERRRVQLLASMQRIPWDAGEGQNLANVLELAPESLRIESPMRLESGQRLALSFFLPSNRDGSSERVSVTCRVTEACDDMALEYEAEVDLADAAAARAIEDFLSKPPEACE
jgi:hypothetical protein